VLVAVLLAACGDGSPAGDEATTSTATSTTSMSTTTTSAAAVTTTATTAEVDETGEQLTVEGVVIAVDGNLDTVASFTLRLSDGSDLMFTPDEGAQFDGGPIGHIREHLTSGAPVRVDYVVLGDGTNLAMEVGDA
jgi:hypothetical protein